MNGFDQPIRPGRDDGEGSLPLARLRLPRLVESCEPEQPSVCGMNLERLAVGPRSAPLVETIGRNYAAALRERVLERRPCLDRFRLRVNAGSCGAAIGRPAIHETPARREEVARFVRRADHEVILDRRDVLVRLVVAQVLFVHAEQLGEFAAILPSQGKAPAHDL